MDQFKLIYDLKDAVNKRKTTITETARAINVDRTTIHAWYGGQQMMHHNAKKLEKYLSKINVNM